MVAGQRATIIDHVAGKRVGCAHSVVLELNGEGCAQFARKWCGSVQWIQKSPYRPNHGRKNWFVGVAEISLPKGDYLWNPGDVEFETMRSSGPGGQHVNKTESAVRARHLPTGTTVVVRSERSQLQNKRAALVRLSTMVIASEKERTTNAQQASWCQHNELKRGNPIAVFVGENFHLKERQAHAAMGSSGALRSQGIVRKTSGSR